MTRNWKTTLKDILNKHFPAEKSKSFIEEIAKITKDAPLLTVSDQILLPTYISGYVIGFIGVDLEKKKLYYCVDDQKTGAVSHFEEFDLSDKEVTLLSKQSWPFDAHSLTHYIYTTLPYFHLFKKDQ